MAPPRPQEEEEASDGSEEQDISLRRSPRHRVKRNVAGGKVSRRRMQPPLENNWTRKQITMAEVSRMEHQEGEKRKQQMMAKVSRKKHRQEGKEGNKWQERETKEDG